MNYESLKEYLKTVNIQKKETDLIKNFCNNNNIEIKNFFKDINGEYEKYFIMSVFNSIVVKKSEDKELLTYFLKNKKDIPVDFEKILKYEGRELDFKDLLGYSEEKELNLLIEKKQYNKIINLIKDNKNLKNHVLLKDLIITDFTYIEKFIKNKIPFSQESYNELDVFFNNVLNSSKTKNNNLLFIDKFYEFIQTNCEKIKDKSMENYLSEMIKYASLHVNDDYKESIWDGEIVAIIHSKKFPNLLKNDFFLFNINKFIFRNIKDIKNGDFFDKENLNIENISNNFNKNSIIKTLSYKEKVEILINFINEFKVENYNKTCHIIMKQFTSILSETFIKDFFDAGLKEQKIFNNRINNDRKIFMGSTQFLIDESDDIFKNKNIKKYNEIIASKIFKYNNQFKYDFSLIKNFLKMDDSLLDKQDFLKNLNSEEAEGLTLFLNSKNLNNLSKEIMNLRLSSNLNNKGYKTHKIKI